MAKRNPLLDKGHFITVGYILPNDRAEVYDLIENIKSVFGYSIAVFDIATLIKLAVNVVLFDKGIKTEELYSLEGFVNVQDSEE